MTNKYNSPHKTCRVIHQTLRPHNKQTPKRKNNKEEEIKKIQLEIQFSLSSEKSLQKCTSSLQQTKRET